MYPGGENDTQACTWENICVPIMLGTFALIEFQVQKLDLGTQIFRECTNRISINVTSNGGVFVLNPKAFIL